MSNLSVLVKQACPDLSDTVATLAGDALADAVRELRELSGKAKSADERLILSLTAQAVAVYGAAGIAKARKAIDDLLSGKQARLDFVDAKTRSEAVALLQRAEADSRSRLRAFSCVAGDALAVVLAKVLQTMLVV